MYPIRPNLPPAVQPNAAPKPADAARAAAQRAFFEIAFGKAPGPVQASEPTPAAVAGEAGVRTAQAAPGAAPNRLARPGSLLDIRV